MSILQVLGRNCRFLQGPGTDPKHIDLIRNAVAKGNDFSINLQFQKKLKERAHTKLNPRLSGIVAQP